MQYSGHEQENNRVGKQTTWGEKGKAITKQGNQFFSGFNITT
jgi:hypothetical protein